MRWIAAVPGSRGPAIVPITPWPHERGLEARVLHVAGEHVGHRVLEQELASSPASAHELVARRRRPDQRIAQRDPEALEELLVGDDALDVARGEALAAQVLGGPRRVEELRHRAPVGQRAPEVRVGERHAVAVAREVQLGDDGAVEQPDEVRARAHDRAGVAERPLERARAAELRPPLEDDDRAPGAGQVGGGGEPVVAAADDDGIPDAPGQLTWRDGGRLEHVVDATAG